jgi:hypothetical protein
MLFVIALCAIFSVVNSQNAVASDDCEVLSLTSEQIRVMTHDQKKLALAKVDRCISKLTADMDLEKAKEKEITSSRISSRRP